MPPTKSASPETLRVAHELAAHLAADRPDLLPLYSQLLGQLTACKPGPGFASVLWHGKSYSFTKEQARAMRCLWEAWEAGTPDVWDEDVLTAAGTEKVKLSEVFKGAPAWKEMIFSVQRGSHRLGKAEDFAPETTPENTPLATTTNKPD